MPGVCAWDKPYTEEKNQKQILWQRDVMKEMGLERIGWVRRTGYVA
jgi:hypothetical protein